MAQLARALRDRLQHGLHVGRRLADHAQHLGGRRLPLERLLGLVEQPRVLDRDHRLVGERLRERDLLVVETPGGRAQDRDAADRLCPRAAAATNRQDLYPSAIASSCIRANSFALSAVSATLTTRESRMQVPAPLPRSSGHGFSMPGPRAAPVSSDRRPIRSRSPLGNTSATALPAKSRWQLATIASNTGCVSVTEPLIDAQDLGGRRLPLERLVGLVEQARVLDRDHRLVGERLEQRVLALAQPVDLFAEHATASRRRGLPTSAVRLRPTCRGSSAARPARPAAPRRSRRAGRGSRPAVRCGSPARSAFRRAVAGTRARIRASISAAPASPRRRRAASVTRNTGTSTWSRSSTMPSAKACAGNRRSQHSTIFSNTGEASAIEWLMTSQHLGGRRLLLERLARLVEEAHVLDRDHRLVGEGLQEMRSALSAYWPGIGHATTIAPTADPSFSIGAPSMRRQPARVSRGLVVVRVKQRVPHQLHCAGDDDSAAHCSRLGGAG